VGRRPAGPVGPYSVEAHAGRLGGPHAFRLGLLLRGWGVRRLELKGLEPHEGWVREVYRPKRPPAFARAKEYIRIL